MGEPVFHYASALVGVLHRYVLCNAIGLVLPGAFSPGKIDLA